MKHYTSGVAEQDAYAVWSAAKSVAEMPPAYVQQNHELLREARDMLNDALNEMQEAA